MKEGRLSRLALANSFAIIGLIGYILCILGTLLFPESVMTLFDSWFHGVDITKLAPSDGDWVFGTGNVMLGIITVPLISWVFGYGVAYFYNLFNKEAL